ncbi:uncharacterized protein LOC105694132 [Athalia rosae]|uniref:uncharacterized protein LOC105694132 n=1 Tax=Athalia rosae TaxID=37344 RepID=UPI0020349E28|nr:uncharacterized protein LOC105694132 [Athalia rosae]
MASSFSTKIDNLRKRSRVLLTCLEENAKVVRKEVKKFRLQNSSSARCLENRQSIHGRNSDIWKLRNDSSSVGAALCPDYFRLSPKYEFLSQSAPDMSAHRRVLINTDVRQSNSPPPRSGVKECYCYFASTELRNSNRRSARTRRNLIASKNYHETELFDCGNCGDSSVPETARSQVKKSGIACKTLDKDFTDPVYSPPMSDTTLRRAQKIDYTPRSEFLKKVRSKVNCNLLTSPPATKSPVRLTSRSTSPSPRRFRHSDSGRTSRVSLDLGRNLRPAHSDRLTGSPVIGNICEINLQRKNNVPRKHNCLNEEALLGMTNKIPKKTTPPKKTITSKKTTIDQQKFSDSKNQKGSESKARTCCSKPTLKSPPPILAKKNVRTTDKDGHSSPRARIDNLLGEDRCLKRPTLSNYGKTCPCSEYLPGKFSDEICEDEPLAADVNEARKFREKNYFDTHASSPSLLESRSSDYLQQYCLNERLFPEPMGRIRREDLVVSIPPCATLQNKSIHYFPNNIVKQVKNVPAIAKQFKKRRYHNCPLIGHAVDLGVLKVSYPPNSLALRHQKGVPG